MRSVYFDDSKTMSWVLGINDRNTQYLEILLSNEIYVKGNCISADGPDYFEEFISKLIKTAKERKEELSESEIFMEYQLFNSEFEVNKPFSKKECSIIVNNKSVYPKSSKQAEFIDALNMEVELLHPGIVGNFSRDAFENTLAYDVTNYNRLILLMLCAKRFRTDLYTGSKIDNIEGLNIHGKVHYYNEMPWVFATSRINLNSSFISIQSGIPLRALDILASGGLLVSNRQPELADTFIEDKEVVLYTGFDEAIDKISYYLAHEEKRVKIVESGRKKVYEKCNMTDRIKEILSISFNE